MEERERKRVRKKGGGVRADPVEVVEGLTVLLDLLLGEPLGVSDEDLVLCLVLGSLDGQQQSRPVGTKSLHSNQAAITISHSLSLSSTSFPSPSFLRPLTSMLTVECLLSKMRADCVCLWISSALSTSGCLVRVSASNATRACS